MAGTVIIYLFKRLLVSLSLNPSSAPVGAKEAIISMETCFVLPFLFVKSNKEAFLGNLFKPKVGYKVRQPKKLNQSVHMGARA